MSWRLRAGSGSAPAVDSVYDYVDTVYMNVEPSLRDRLVRAGVAVVEQDGVAGLSLRAITRRAGVSHGAPRRYFPTHNALLAAIAATGFADLLDDFRPALSDLDALAVERLVRLGTAYAQFAERRPAMFELMFRHDLLEGAGANLRGTTLPLFDTLTDLVAEASGRQDDARERALGLWTSVHGAAVLVANRSLRLVASPLDADAPLDLSGLVARAVDAYVG